MSRDAYSSLLAVILLVAVPAWAAEPVSEAAGESGPESPSAGDSPAAEGERRTLSGTSVIGNRELPKSLYIVPWKNSEVGVRTDLSRDLLDEGLAPVDPQEFERQVQYHEYHQQQQ